MIRTEQDAIDLCKRLMLAFQKARSNLLEADLEPVAALLNPWLFGEKSIVPLLGEIVDGTRRIDPMGMVNVLWVANRPEMRAAFGIWSASYEEDGAPLPTHEAFLAGAASMLGAEWADA